MRNQARLRELRDGVCYLTLDTPNSSVNVLNDALARWLHEEIDAAEAAGARVIVLESGKPGSFLNGVGLMLAGSVREPADAARLTAKARAAYERLEHSSLPTVAAIRGNCYGCGVELTLRCRYRVCADDFDTHFYMTELSEYLFTPIFGATHALPRLIGLEPATRFLIWGERWSAQQAEREGLVDTCFDVADFAARVHEFALSVADRRRERAPRATAAAPSVETVAELRERIAQLPAMYREVYATTFDLMERAACAGIRAPEAEQLAAGNSSMKAESRAARQFFFIRRLAHEVSQRGFDAAEAWQAEFDGSVAAQWLKSELEARQPSGLEWVGRRNASGAGRVRALRFVGYADTPRSDARENTVWIRDRVLGRAPELTGTPLVYAPFRAEGVIEIACRPEHIASARAICGCLTRARFATVVSTPVARLAIDELIRAFCRPLIEHALGRGSKSDAAKTLHELGFLRFPGDWLSGVEKPALAALLAPERAAGADPDLLALLPRQNCSGGRADLELRDALLLSLLSFAISSLDERSLAHPSLVDLLAREVIGFPLGHCSLCRYMTVDRVKSLLPRDRRGLAPELGNVIDFVEQGRDFYL